jgi:hypothetical protein
LRGQHRAAALDLEEPASECLLKARDLITHGRLAAVERLGRRSVSSKVDDAR